MRLIFHDEMTLVVRVISLLDVFAVVSRNISIFVFDLHYHQNLRVPHILTQARNCRHLDTHHGAW